MLLSEILEMRGFPISQTRIIRNTIDRDYIRDLIKSGNFDLYQAVQKEDKFKGSTHIVSFTDLPGTKSLLYGAFKINGVTNILDLPEQLASIKSPEKWIEGSYRRYELQRIDFLKDLEGRLVIDWGKATISWCQKDLKKEVLEIRSAGFLKEFPGYQDVLLNFDELVQVIQNPEANRQWKMMLSNVYGVYLILDTTDGQQYVGSAYGQNGLWGRWSTYVATKHGNNKNITEILMREPNRYKNFQFSILSVLPNSTLKDEVIKLEGIMKKKLGSRVFGLNDN